MTRAARFPRQRRVDGFLRATEYGIVGFVAFVSHRLAMVPGWVAIIGTLLMAVSVFVLLRYRRTDEYTADIWQTGAIWAIVTLLVWDILLPTTVGFVEGLTDTFLLPANNGDLGDGTPSIFDSRYSPTVAYAAFYLGLLWARFRPLDSALEGNTP